MVVKFPRISRTRLQHDRQVLEWDPGNKMAKVDWPANLQKGSPIFLSLEFWHDGEHCHKMAAIVYLQSHSNDPSAALAAAACRKNNSFKPLQTIRSPIRGLLKTGPALFLKALGRC